MYNTNQDNTIVEQNMSAIIDPKSFCVSNSRGDISHINYMEYLQLCWANHWSAVVSPDYIWYTLLCQFSEIVKEHPEVYESLFTTQTGKKTNILIPTDDETIIPLDILMDHLVNYVPSDCSPFVSPFSTTNDRAQFAFYAAFADTISPYYTYEMYLCNIPKIYVTGTLDDWDNICKRFHQICSLLNISKTEYAQRCKLVLNDMKNNLNNEEYWLDIFKLERCGSGHQHEVSGFYKNLFYKIPSVLFTCNFSTCVSIINYRNISTDTSYCMRYGLFSSTLENGILIPDFSYIVT